jgi:outer membrane protein
MTNKQNLFNLLVSIAVIALFTLYLLSGQTKNVEAPSAQTPPTETTEETTDFSDIEIQAVEHPAGSLLIAFVNEDTLAELYLYSVDIRKKLETNTTSAQSKLKARYEAFQKEVQSAEEKAPTMYQDELAKLQQEFAQKERSLLQYEQQLQEQVMKFEEEELRKYNELTKDAIEKLAVKMGYDFILIRKPGSALLYAKPDFDITKQVVDYLNQEYKKRKSDKAK